MAVRRLAGTLLFVFGLGAFTGPEISGDFVVDRRLDLFGHGLRAGITAVEDFGVPQQPVVDTPLAAVVERRLLALGLHQAGILEHVESIAVLGMQHVVDDAVAVAEEVQDVLRQVARLINAEMQVSGAVADGGRERIGSEYFHVPPGLRPRGSGPYINFWSCRLYATPVSRRPWTTGRSCGSGCDSGSRRALNHPATTLRRWTRSFSAGCRKSPTCRRRRQRRQGCRIRVLPRR
uniref:Uncharacterized protein n=1 Tax=uncultured marine microorganism HF4000_APKG10F13 TaxID=455557 RepID=B3TBS3_9ZZZZ|nr:hypothetical protein ALOHA_HF4000APKG10F13ctg1g15 [uncultured marine microorganism HF4000_APKG10F13]